jgi:hypothetical protein
MELNYEDSYKGMTGPSFWDRFATIPGAIESRLPTLDKSLDAYFDRHFVQIIEEWDLVTESELAKFEHRLSRITDDISELCAERTKTEARVKELTSLIASLEERS